RDELDAGSNPADPPARLALLVASPEIPVGTELLIEAQVGPLPAPALGIHWRKYDELLAGATGTLLSISKAAFPASGIYEAAMETAFGAYTSAPVTIRIVPAVVTVTPAEQAVRLESNALLTATAVGVGPFEYQWQFNGANLSGASAGTLSLSNVQ